MHDSPAAASLLYQSGSTTSRVSSSGWVVASLVALPWALQAYNLAAQLPPVSDPYPATELIVLFIPPWLPSLLRYDGWQIPILIGSPGASHCWPRSSIYSFSPMHGNYVESGRHRHRPRRARRPLSPSLVRSRSLTFALSFLRAGFLGLVCHGGDWFMCLFSWVAAAVSEDSRMISWEFWTSFVILGIVLLPPKNLKKKG